ncbi:MAG: hypothetical protein IKB02_03140 [Clostridia bacterium]|nr:hypothetical protein [Clostridia bacterium]
MRKTLSIICMILVVATLLTVSTFAVSKAPYEELGQKLFVTGNDYAPKAIAIDGVINDDEGWVAVTPNGTDMYAVTATMNKANSAKVLEIDHTFDSQLQNMPKVEYFVAQDSDYVYLAIKYYENPTIYKFIKTEAKNSMLTYVRLGFNANDYTEQLCLYSSGQYKTQDKAVDPFPKWTDYPLEVQGVADKTKYTAKTNADTGIIEKEYLDSRMEQSKDGRYNLRTYEAKLSKAKIKELYASAFGSADGVDFKTLYIGVSACDYAWRNKAEDVDYRVVHGTVLDEATATANGVTSFLPDMIYFGDVTKEDAPAGETVPTVGADEPIDKPIDEGDVGAVTEPATAGCGGAISLAGLALVATLGTCTAFVAKKKDN